VDLENINMKGAGATALAEALMENVVVTSVDLSSNNVGPDGARALAEAFKVNTAISFVDLHANDIGSAGTSALAEAFKVNDVITHLGLSANGIGPAGAFPLAEALKINTVITFVDLSSNILGPEGAEYLIDAFAVNTAVTSADFSVNFFGDAGAIALAEALKQNTAIRSLDLKVNNIGSPGASALAEALKVNSVVTLVDLYANDFGAEGATALAEAFKVNTAITSMLLGRNKIMDVGASSLADALQVNTAIKTVNLRDSGIHSIGALALAAAFKINTAVTELQLSSNSIGPGGASSLAEAIKVNSAITIFYLDSNAIGDSGAAALAEAFKVNSAITTVDLADNDIGEAGAVSLAEALKLNFAITSLRLDGNAIPPEWVAAFAWLTGNARNRSAACNGSGIVSQPSGKCECSGLPVLGSGPTCADKTVCSAKDLGLAEIQTNESSALLVPSRCRILQLQGAGLGPAGAAALADVLTMNSVITWVDLNENGIGDAGLIMLAEAFKLNSAVTSIDLSRNGIGPVGAAALAEALKVNAVISSVNLHDNQIGDEGASLLASAFKVNTALTGVGMRLNSIGDEGAASLAEALQMTNAIKSVNLKNNKLTDVGAASLAGALKLNPVITSAQIGFNNYRREEWTVALAWLAKSAGQRSFTKCSGSGVFLESTGKCQCSEFAILGSGPTCSDIVCDSKDLMLTEFQAGEVGDIVIPTRCTELDLSNATIGDAGAASLARALVDNTAIVVVGLGSNKIGDLGAELLANAFAKNYVIRAMNLSHNLIGNVGAAAFAEVPTIKNATFLMDLSGNLIEDKWMSVLMCYNPTTAHALACSRASSTNQTAIDGAVIAVVSVCVMGLGCVVAVLAVRRKQRLRKECAVEAMMATMIARKAQEIFMAAFPHILRKFSDDRKDAVACIEQALAAVLVPRGAVRLGEVVGTGRFGKRFAATLRPTLANMAPGEPSGIDSVDVCGVARECRVGVGVSLEDAQRFVAEAYLLVSLQHKNILRVVAVVTSSVSMLVVTELMLNRDLKTFLRACRPTLQTRKENLDVKSLLRVSSLVVEACEFLEERKVVHRALMASNVLVGVDHRDIRLGGLDSLREVGGADYDYVTTSATKDQLDIRWLAPESIEGNRYTVKSDVWSFGVLLWEVVSYARAPFGAYKAAEIAAEVLNGKRLGRPHGCPEELFDCMSLCWEKCPAARPTFAKIRGAINMLLLEDADMLRKKVVAAATISPVDFRWEISIAGLQIVQADESCGGLTFSSGMAGKIWTGGLSLARLPGVPVNLVLVAESTTAEEVRWLRHRFNVIQELHHRNVVELFGCSSAVGFAMVYSRPTLGPLLALLSNYETQPGLAAATPASAGETSASVPLPCEVRGKIGLHIALGIEFLHANNFVHGYISPHTVYVDENFNARVVAHMVQSISSEAAIVKLAPAQQIQAKLRSGLIAGAGLRWQAPETILGQPTTFASDVFALGMVLWSLLTAESPLPYYPQLESDQAIVETVVESEGRLPLLPPPTFRLRDNASKAGGSLADFSAVFRGCTKRKPRDRPAAASVATDMIAAVEGRDHWEVDRNSLTVVEKLGEGQFGDVMKMATTLFSDDGSMDFVAAKMLKAKPLAPPIASIQDLADAENQGFAKAEADFLSEIALMKQLRHPNLVTLLGVCTRAPPFLALIEFLKGGSLDNWLPTNGHMLLQPAPTKLIYMLHQIALGCQALARAGIVHRDLAARNVLVGERLHVKVADYGLSREVDQDRNYYRLATERPLPLRWTAPEALAALTWTSASDCYSFGIVVVEMFTLGGFPFEKIKSDSDFMAVLTGSVQIHPLLLEQVAAILSQHNTSVPSIVVELVQRCTMRDPSCRPTFEELAHLTTCGSPALIDGGSTSGNGSSTDRRRSSSSATVVAVSESESHL
jgi:serine/threonine protein kinase/Ran GTPase-activating protein (RanGAP) involved in mRNA processing and transport